jgi:hypothetical protein
MLPGVIAILAPFVSLLDLAVLSCLYAAAPYSPACCSRVRVSRLQASATGLTPVRFFHVTRAAPAFELWPLIFIVLSWLLQLGLLSVGQMHRELDAERELQSLSQQVSLFRIDTDLGAVSLSLLVFGFRLCLATVLRHSSSPTDQNSLNGLLAALPSRSVQTTAGGGAAPAPTEAKHGSGAGTVLQVHSNRRVCGLRVSLPWLPPLAACCLPLAACRFLAIECFLVCTPPAVLWMPGCIA